MDFKNKLILAPMAGVCDQPFRLLCKEQGCDILYSEMVSAKAIYYNNKNTKPLLAMDEREKPFGLQLFGSDPEIMAEMARRIEGNGYSFIDVNMGCPVPKVVNNGEGSALMKDPLLVGKIVEAIANAINIPLTIKIRSGFDAEHINAPEIAHIAQESGAAAVAVHGRTRQQYYQGHADWGVIARVKQVCSIPVIGNGDIMTPQDIIDMKEQTKCDGFMIGRGARGNPWIFNEIKYYMQYGEIPPRPSIHEVKQTILRHARLMVEFKGEYTGIHEMRKHVAWYSVGMYDSARLRNQVNGVESYSELEDLMDSWEESFPV
ncbi:MAG: tRNA dihydrouridine synthase DusB [Clostridiales bacterium]|nr:tRNA dihydrouridine synthase DusB [Clostridiales bacterium]